MKFIHLADVHLGIVPDKNRSWSQERSQEIYDTFKKVILSAKQQNVDMVLIAGDLFHGQPILKTLKEINYLFEKISPVKVVIIAGNHDYIRDNSFYNTFEWSKNVHFFLNEHIERIEFEDLNTDIYGLSYRTREIRKPLYDELVAEDPDKINILLGHGGDANHIPVNDAVFQKNGFDYSAFGHIHKGSINKGKRFAFSGAPEPTDKNDFGEKGYILGNIDEHTKKLELEFVPCARRQYITMKINCNSSVTNNALVDKISEKITALGCKNIYRIVLTGTRHESMEFDIENELRNYNVLEITDETHVDYNYEKIASDNEGTILSQIIKKLQSVDEDAMFYAVNALLRTKR